MSTLTAAETQALEVAPRAATHRLSRPLATWVAILSFVVGFGAVLGGMVGAWYTYDQAATQNITTPSDAVIPDTPVLGPVTMWAQIDIINHHQLERTGGLYYAEMDRTVPHVDEAGEPVLDSAGEPVMVPNQARLSWIDATSLTTTLSMGILAYAFAAFAVVVGAVLVLNGFFVLSLRRALT